jgi:hypothetical protein
MTSSHRTRRRSALAALAAAVLLLATPAGVRADGDPASDVLPEQPVFFGSAVDLKSKPAAQLDALVRESTRRGYAINVVVISRLEDMGSANYLFNDPDNYADFLTGEIACCVKGRVLIVMPGGFGVTYIGHSSVADRKVVHALPPPGGIGNLLSAAIGAVRRLAASAGVRLAVPDVAPAANGVYQPTTHVSAQPIQTQSVQRRPSQTGGSQSTPAWLYLLPILVLVAFALAFALVGRRRSRAGSTDEPPIASGDRRP